MADEAQVQAPAVVAARGPGLWARLFPPLTPEQAAIMVQVKLPCC
ncbi:hypothetical protein [Paragemmobacter kunshanensis]|nr:hypothetical protein [Rhodobacter kunshanensis]